MNSTEAESEPKVARRNWWIPALLLVASIALPILYYLAFQNRRALSDNLFAFDFAMARM